MIVRGLIDRCFEARSRGRQALGFFLDRPDCLTYIDVVDYMIWFYGQGRGVLFSDELIAP